MRCEDCCACGWTTPLKPYTRNKERIYLCNKCAKLIKKKKAKK